MQRRADEPTVGERGQEVPVSGGADRGRAIWGTALRSATAVVLLLAVYYQAPLDRRLDAASGLVFVAALVLFAALVAVEVRGILRSRRPRLRATRALPLGVPFLLVVFGASYCTVSAQQPEAFNEPLGRRTVCSPR
jgi:voltage-gated potassium channel